jgi:hypothetical protein
VSEVTVPVSFSFTVLHMWVHELLYPGGLSILYFIYDFLSEIAVKVYEVSSFVLHTWPETKCECHCIFMHHIFKEDFSIKTSKEITPECCFVPQEWNREAGRRGSLIGVQPAADTKRSWPTDKCTDIQVYLSKYTPSVLASLNMYQACFIIAYWMCMQLMPFLNEIDLISLHFK